MGNEIQRACEHVWSDVDNLDGRTGRINVWFSVAKYGPKFRQSGKSAVFGWAVKGFLGSWYWEDEEGVALAVEALNDPAAYRALLDWMQEHAEAAREWDGRPLSAAARTVLRARLAASAAPNDETGGSEAL